MNEKFSRRTLLSLKTYSSEAVHTSTTTTKEASLYDTEQIDAAVSAAIQEHLELSSDRVECFIRPGNHVIDPNHI